MTGEPQESTNRMASYRLKDELSRDGKAVYWYKNNNEYLFYSNSSKAWIIGPDYNDDAGWLRMETNVNTDCPVDHAESWEEYDGNTWALSESVSANFKPLTSCCDTVEVT
jgi:hypothetical protein